MTETGAVLFPCKCCKEEGYKLCENCEGKGRTFYQNSVAWHRERKADSPVEYEATCETCEGNGRRKCRHCDGECKVNDEDLNVFFLEHGELLPF